MMNMKSIQSSVKRDSFRRVAQEKTFFLSKLEYSSGITEVFFRFLLEDWQIMRCGEFQG